jgi:hypothetical protein
MGHQVVKRPHDPDASAPQNLQEQEKSQSAKRGPPRVSMTILGTGPVEVDVIRKRTPELEEPSAPEMSVRKDVDSGLPEVFIEQVQIGIAASGGHMRQRGLGGT